jgi:hypothetical protein
VNSPAIDRPANHAALARQVRGVFVEQATQLLADLSKAISARLSTLFEQSTNARESQDRRDAMIAFQQGGGKWLEGTDRAWKNASQTDLTTSSTRLPALNLELIGNEVVESKILSSRLAMRMLDKAGFEFSDLQVRMRMLEDKEELDKSDILRPEACAQHLLEQWLAANLSQESWLAVQDVIQRNFADKIPTVYKACNEFLIAQGVMQEIDLRSNLRRAPNAKVSPSEPTAKDEAVTSGGTPLEGDKSFAPTAFGRAAASLSASQRPMPPTMGAMSKAGRASSQVSAHIAKLRAQAAEYAAQQAAQQAARLAAAPSLPSGLDGLTANGMFAPAAAERPGQAGALASNGGGPAAARPGRSAVADYIAQAEAEETRMQTATTPLARARMRAQGVMGQLKQMLVQRVEGFDDTRAPQMSPQLAAAMTPRPAVRTPGYQRTQQGSSGQSAMMSGPIYAGVSVQIVEGMQAGQVKQALREQTKDLKKAASTDGEKATIEIVALMFQSILAEERIPTNVRVWFARLQMPVLRLALSEPEFFGTTQHPARRLIDRMGSCVLGFDANVGSVELEAEIKRIVQTIEQYPETGRRVFQLVFEEFEKFLSKFLTGSQATAKVVTLAQQVEQKETAAIQYTIELRKMLGNLPMRDEIREFLFKVWAEVMAVGAMKNGPQHESTLALKKVAADLLWAASAKPNRAERAKVIADLPDLLKRLRLGMGLLGLSLPVQDAHIKSLSDTLADAFMSKAATMDQSQVIEVAQRIRNLEDFVSEEEVGDLPLDAESIELTLGIDMSGVEIVSEGGTEPTQAMRAWAMELDRGSWFHLDIKGKMKRVQYSWRSTRGQLFLFADASGLTYLFQLKRLAAYLQAGLMTPIEDETLTVRATRAALTKLDANPDRLLNTP